MRIDKTHNINNLVNKKSLELPKEDLSQDLGLESPIVYEKTKLGPESQVYSLTTIEELSQGSVDLLGQLKEMLKDMLTDQVKTLNLLKQEDNVKVNIEKINIVEVDGLRVDEKMIAEAKEAIWPGGLVGEERMSQEIVEFVKQAAEGKKGKLQTLRLTIDKAFNEAEESLGPLPGASQRTYNMIMAGLSDLEEDLERSRYPGWPIFAVSMNLYRRIKIYSSFGIKIYMSIILASVVLYYALRYLIG